LASSAAPVEVDPQSGFLPPGIHPYSWDDFVRVFVDGAPHPEHRRKRLAALEVYLDCLAELFPQSTLWLDGGFVSHKQDPPFDIDILVKVSNGDWARVMKVLAQEAEAFNDWGRAGATGMPPKIPNTVQFAGLQTMHEVQTGGMVLPRVQPFGGRVDGFIVPANAAKSLDQFRRDWMLDMVSGTKKGFVEVNWDGR
jgi:hypothetical protein